MMWSVVTGCVLLIAASAVLDTDVVIPEDDQHAFFKNAASEFPSEDTIDANFKFTETTTRPGNIGPDPVETEATEKHLNTGNAIDTNDDDDDTEEEFPGDSIIKASIPEAVHEQATACTQTCQENGCESEEDAEKVECTECAQCHAELEKAMDGLGGNENGDDITNPNTDISGHMEPSEDDDSPPPYTSEDATLSEGHYFLGGGRRRVGAGFAPVPTPGPANETQVQPLEETNDEDAEGDGGAWEGKGGGSF